MQKIVLATESTYKKALFSRLNLNFDSVAANVSEIALENEQAETLAARLAREKAEELKSRGEHKYDWVIGADQAAQCGKYLVSKPGTHQQAAKDLSIYSGNKVDFYTAVCVMPPEQSPIEFTDKTSVLFRNLAAHEIENYLRIEQPYDCAGAFKAEGLGITLFNSIESEDPTALIGLPLIKLAQALRSQGLNCYTESL